ncbi:hypothetical protein CEXT_763211 [Caerostris extrusa]|uniref:Uncharacterized protein n=1 Tax=Caerostris extrusa TaxID=172846 RepID=A0AAV4MV12_CAEEX|nr:hypothetical protein CEXT_763211 [Caerostris extrusa]
MILDQRSHQTPGIILLMYDVTGLALRNSSKRWALLLQPTDKHGAEGILAIQSNQNTKDLVICKIIQEVPRWNKEENLPFIGTEPIKEALPKTTDNQLCPVSPVKVRGIPSIWTDLFLHATVVERLE